jgi:PKD repeat protein
MPTFGHTTPLTGTEIWESLPYIASDTQYFSACRFLCPENATSTLVSYAVRGRYAACNAKIMIYADAGAQAGDLLGESSVLAIGTDKVMRDFPVTNVPLTSGTYYWLAIFADAEIEVAHVAGTSKQTEFGWMVPTFPVPPNPFLQYDGPGWENNESVAYCTYSPAVVTPLTVNAGGPYTAFTGSPTVVFAGSASGGTTPYKYAWAFGDGGTSTLQSPSHTYNGVVATYNAVLTVTDSGNPAQVASAVAVVTIIQGVPPLNVSVAPSSANLVIGSSPVTFTANVTGGTPPYSIQWIDNTNGSVIGTGTTYVFTPSTAGSYSIKAHVTDSASVSADSVNVLITVSAQEDYVVAASGSRADIQAAHDLAVTQGKHNVRIPGGTFTFTGQVVGRGGINFFGDADAPNTSDPKKGCGTIRTILQLSGSQSTMFYIHGENGQPVTISGIHFKGHSGSTGDVAVELDCVKNFRVYNNRFELMGSVGVYTDQKWMDTHSGTFPIQGVIYRNSFINIYKDAALQAGTGYGYGIACQRGEALVNRPWVTDITPLMGNPADTVYAEDNYFMGCRHCIMQDGSAYYCFRYNYIEKHARVLDGGHWMIDVHPPRTYDENYSGGRWAEIYGNVLVGNQSTPGNEVYGITIDGGAAFIWGNTFQNPAGYGGIYYAYGFDLTTATSRNTPPSFIQQCKPHQVYIWNNVGDKPGNVVMDNPYVTNPEYTSTGPDYLTPGQHGGAYDVHLYNISPATDGLNYVPYTYPHPLTQEVPPTARTVVIASATGGTTTPAAGTYSYDDGSTLTVTAAPSPSYSFTGWDVNGSNYTINPLVITVNQDLTVQPIFQYTPPTQRTLTILSGAGGTTVPPVGTQTYNNGASATITATANAGYNFTNWLLDGVSVSGNPYTLVMNADHTIQPVFTPITPNQYTLTITAAINGSTNPAQGSYQIAAGLGLQVFATSSAHYVFDHWELDGVNVGSANPLFVTMNSNHTLTAVFAPIMFSLAILATAGGTTIPAPQTYQFLEGTVQQVAAVVQSGYKFVQWTLNGSAVTANPISVTMTTNYTLQAIFDVLPPPPTGHNITVNAALNGTTNPPPNAYQVEADQTFQVTAVPSPGYMLDHWELDGTNIGSNNPVSVMMSADHVLTPVFVVSPILGGFPWYVVIVIAAAAGGAYLMGGKKTSRG